ncbi:MAG: hypothetical protein K9K66_01035 [Desulfarculaceae bacterium]|nr:hypothetical protein [Desulfarculaceae bacterium]MCF8072297.1 hypothetical protein [Desulfarculaceae bacterium]MCF8100218.1 hypothetical protein [Desulfarculaceae bacterium]MCF8116209.1 hypothetical protein [Desulfarculaceae bacterium]
MTESTRANLVKKEGLCSLIVLALLGLGAVAYPLAPVGAAPAGHADAPWVFLGLQQLLRFLPVSVGGLLLPAIGLALLAALPWLTTRGGLIIPAYRAPKWWELPAWAVLLGWAGLTAWAWLP